MLENVPEFRASEEYLLLEGELKEKGYCCRKFVITPRSIGIPNERNRFFLIAFLPNSTAYKAMKTDIVSQWSDIKDKDIDIHTQEIEGNDNKEHAISSEVQYSLRNPVFKETITLPSINQWLSCGGDDKWETDDSLLLPFKKEDPNYQVLDIPKRDTSSTVTMRNTDRLVVSDTPTVKSYTACFTKNYSRYYKGTGSVLRNPDGRIRLMHPMEMAKLMGFTTDKDTDNHKCLPDILKNENNRSCTCLPFERFSEFSNSSYYKVLGNSLNPMLVMAIIIDCFV